MISQDMFYRKEKKKKRVKSEKQVEAKRTEIDLSERSATNFPTETELVPNSRFHYSTEILRSLGN